MRYFLVSVLISGFDSEQIERERLCYRIYALLTATSRVIERKIQ